MRILITNDDGIHSPGIDTLERIARALSDDVWVVAPEFDQSGLSHSLSLNDPLRLREIGEQRFAVRGTPGDCVIMAVRKLIGAKPDLVLSGVNSGANVADDVTYSGTIAGAIEGTLIGVPSVALSQDYSYADNARLVPWHTAEALGPDVIQKLVEFGFPAGIFYSVNFPNLPAADVRGVLVTSQGELTHALHVDERRDGRNLPYYWLTYRRDPAKPAPGSDNEALDRGLISITPLRLDMTAHEVMAPLQGHFNRS